MRQACERLIEDIKKELKALQKKIPSLWEIDVSGVSECESRIQKVDSKLRNLTLALALQGSNAYRKDIQTIADSFEALTKTLKRKSSFKKMLSSLLFCLGPLSQILAIFGIHLPILPPGIDGSYAANNLIQHNPSIFDGFNKFK